MVVGDHSKKRVAYYYDSKFYFVLARGHGPLLCCFTSNYSVLRLGRQLLLWSSGFYKKEKLFGFCYGFNESYILKCCTLF